MNFLLTGNIIKTDETSDDQTSLLTPGTVLSDNAETSDNHIPLIRKNTIIESDEPHKNTFVDKLTMEYMMNRTHYKKYLAKTNVTKYQETQEQIQFMKEHADDIQHITNELLTDFIRHGDFTQYNTQINTTFGDFLHTCINYLKEKEFTTKDDDVLFPN